ncbi:CPBP family intramembrane glutamic endopeptidase [Prevotella sp. oral taxon 317]|uniref:CPBP family intramembrane glutamic endopeptidase n=1 Tax=Prevotella sp. oral taxon 317 TaxID=652721 RepID=UPI0001C40544|nr:type II CAAX endopeptidase family protein [Prevotella sp. oral taxon 317]EFC68543.1 CAAX amino terminal protease family protein [Prevotella sp. oral taxon 317 str. F0108]
MIIISKDDNLAWGCYLVLGVLAFLIIPGVVGYVLLLNIPAYAAVPLSTIAAVATLYAFKKYLSWYVENGESLSFRGKMRMMGIGWAVSVVNFLAIIVCLFLCGCYRIVNVELDVASQLSWLSLFLLVGVVEEVIFRGILFRLIADKWNIAVGLTTSSLLFGLAHLGNPGATLWAALAIALASGWLFGMAYAYHQTIWVPVGMHWAWNYLEGGVFGCAVSGTPLDYRPLITPRISGTDLLSGGAFGPEASIICVAIGIGISIVYTMLYIKKRKRLGAKPEMLF